MRLGYPTLFGLCVVVVAYYVSIVDYWYLKLLLGSVAVCFVVVTFAYAGLGSKAYMKNTQGQLPWITRILCWPFLLLNHALNRVTVHVQQLNAADEVIEGLYLGRHCSRNEAGMLIKTKQIQAVIDLEAEAGEAKPFRELTNYHLLPVIDRQPVPQHVLEHGVEKIRQYLKDGPVLVHCALGRGRSAMLVVAYLLATGHQPNVEAALLYVNSCRRGVALHSDQKRALERYMQSIQSK